MAVDLYNALNADTITAQGNGTTQGTTLDLTGTVNGPTLAINATPSGSDLKIDGTATAPAISITNPTQTLEVGAAPANLTLTGAQTVSLGNIQLDGGTLTVVKGGVASGARR